MTEWIQGWIRKGWKNSKKEEVLNRDLWERLLALSKKHQIQWRWVRGHDGHRENERCDELAREAIIRGRKG
jgi:ribonuclease HI